MKNKLTKLIALGLSSVMMISSLVITPSNTAMAAESNAKTVESSFATEISKDSLPKNAEMLFSSDGFDTLSKNDGYQSATILTSKTGKITFLIYTTNYCPVVVSLKNEAGKTVAKATTKEYASDFENTRLMKVSFVVNPGTFTFSYKAVVNTTVASVVYEIPSEVAMPSINVAKGYTTKAAVLSSSIKSVKSSNKKIATVDKKGAVKGKKKGTCTITYKLKDGTKFSFKVKVVNNKLTHNTKKYEDAKNDNTAYVVIKSASYDKKGNLVCNVSVLNCLGYTIHQAKDIKFAVYNQSCKKIATVKFSKTGLSIAPGKEKNIKVTVKKSKLKIKKKQDLTQSYQILVGGRVYN